ncbi:hypothetical protein M3M33_14505, partial [Loigolactobacillus coryniformis]|uniref:hypothetical protein n=1 Tax=Loigolactobacillus coryniformis TaxID=1610 RepID=UPI00201B323B
QGAIQALDEHKRNAELAAEATKKLGDTTATAGNKIADGMGAASGALKSFLLGAVSGVAVMAAVHHEFEKFNKQVDSLTKLDDASQAIGE